MKILLMVLLVLCNSAFADEFFQTEQRNISVQQERDRQEYQAQQDRDRQELKSQQENQRKQEAIAAEQRRTDNILREKAIQAQAATDKINAQNAQIAHEAEMSRLAALDNERLAEKARLQKQEDDRLAYIQQKAAQELRQTEAQLKYDEALAAARIKGIDTEAALIQKRTNTEIDIIQSGADANRLVASGINNNLTGKGNEGFFKFMVVIGLIILVLLIGVIVYLLKKKS